MQISLKDAQWKVLQCESNGCPQVAEVADGVALGDTQRPGQGFVYSKADFAKLVKAAKSGELDDLVKE